MNIRIKINPLDYNVENYIKDNINLKPPESYAKMNEKELELLFTQTKNNFSPELTANFSKEIILSIRSNLMRSHMIETHRNLIRNQKQIIKDYDDNSDILKLSEKYDGSPLNLLRLIFKKKYNNKLTKLISNKKILSKEDSIQLEIAIHNDTYALINQNEILDKAIKFENKIKEILIKNKVEFKTQEELAKEQKENSDKITNTPDFLILSELKINDIKINWIDAKNFYGTNSTLNKKNINRQTEKYINEWGTGSIIFNLGFCSKLNFPNILLIDFESFEKI